MHESPLLLAENNDHCRTWLQTYKDVIEVKLVTKSASYPKGELSSVCSVPKTQSEQVLFSTGDASLAQVSTCGAHHAFVALRDLVSFVQVSAETHIPISSASVVIGEDKIVHVVSCWIG